MRQHLGSYKQHIGMALLAAVCGTLPCSGQSLFLRPADFKTRLGIAQREPWAKESLAALLQEADNFPQSYMKRFGLSDAAPPPEGGQWLHWYACPETGRALQFVPPDKNICPDTGKNFTGYPYDHVVYQLRNDALAEAAVALGLAFQFTGKTVYAQKAADILRSYTRIYPGYALHDIHGKPGINGGKAYAQTLDESIWLIKLAWTYDLVRDTQTMSASDRKDFEEKVLRTSAAVVAKAHKEPTYNIQSWINGAIAAVGFVLNDRALITEAIDGPIGFRYQMHTFVHEGVWEEGSWGYQFYAMRPLSMLAQMAELKGVDLWRQEPALLSLFHAPVSIMLPNGTLPAFNDSGVVDLYAKDFLYEVAYAATRDPSLLPVLDHGDRSSREALLFGVEHLPEAAYAKARSEVLPQAGFATLRSATNDLTAVVKFGSHGGAHGHYDKLNFVFYADGMTLAIDPGTQPYGLPIHKAWDAMTIAHNTVSVDQQRQAAATGKLLDWKTGEGWTAVRMDAGPAYTDARLQRTMLLTPEYLLIADECESLDQTPHTFDWAYHNAGTEALVSGQALQPFDQMPKENGYGLLADVKQGTDPDPIAVRFVAQPSRANREHGSNSPIETFRSHAFRAVESSVPANGVQTYLQVLGSPRSTFFLGEAPGPDLRKPVPFVIVRRSGLSANFVAVLAPSPAPNPPAAPVPSIQEVAPHTYRIVGPGYVDTFTDQGTFSYQRQKR